MFITDALRSKVNHILIHMDERADYLTGLDARKDWADDSVLRWAAERSLHVAIECVTDVANLVIDALVMRDPANYHDMLQVLEEERVVTRQWFDAFVSIFEVRSRLVRDYVDMKPEEVRDAVDKYALRFREYSNSIRTFLGIGA